MRLGPWNQRGDSGRHFRRCLQFRLSHVDLHLLLVRLAVDKCTVLPLPALALSTAASPELRDNGWTDGSRWEFFYFIDLGIFTSIPYENEPSFDSMDLILGLLAAQQHRSSGGSLSHPFRNHATIHNSFRGIKYMSFALPILFTFRRSTLIDE